MDRQAFQKAWGKVMARAWADAAFKERLLTAPEAVFQEYGFEVPANIFDQGRFERRPDDPPPVHPARRPRMVRGVHLILLPHAPKRALRCRFGAGGEAGWTDGVTISLGAGR